MKLGKAVNMFCLLLTLVCGRAHARETDGRLGFIRFPISTRPEFVQPGGKLVMEVEVAMHDRSKEALHALLVKDGTSISVDTALMSPGSSTTTYRLEATIPQSAPPGRYDLSVGKGNKSDVSRHAVFVVLEFPSEYSIMHITDVHVGRVDEGMPVGEQVYVRMKDTANRIKPDLIIITGDLSDTSDPAQLKKFVEITEQMEAPTFVVPGNHDRNNADAETFVGPGCYTFYFGKHFYLGFDTQYEFPPPDTTGQMDWIIREVRSNRSAPFKVLFSHRLDSDFHLVLTKVAVPMKVNLMLLGHTHEDEVLKLGGLPSMIVTSPAALDGFYRVVHVKNDAVAGMALENINK